MRIQDSRAAFVTAIISASRGLTASPGFTPGGATLTALAKAWQAPHSIWAFDAAFSSSSRAERDQGKKGFELRKCLHGPRIQTLLFHFPPTILDDLLSIIDRRGG